MLRICVGHGARKLLRIEERLRTFVGDALTRLCAKLCVSRHQNEPQKNEDEIDTW